MPTGAPVSLQQNFTFPARRLFPSLLFFFFPPFCFVPSVLVVKSCTCLFQIPCLLSMHSERVFFFFF